MQKVLVSKVVRVKAGSVFYVHCECLSWQLFQLKNRGIIQIIGGDHMETSLFTDFSFMPEAAIALILSGFNVLTTELPGHSKKAIPLKQWICASHETMQQLSHIAT